MKVNFKILSIGALCLAVASFLYFRDSASTQVTPTIHSIDSVVILKDSISKLQNLNSTLQHEKLEIARQRAIDNNRNASLLALMQSINADLSRQHQDSIRIRQKRPPNKR